MSSEENSRSTPENVDKAVEIPAKKSHSSTKKQVKVPKRIHKAEREKLKREHLNDLFLSLANVLELSEETNGKACVLNEATRIVKDMLAQVKSLRKENEALLSESQYVDIEKNELQDENASLEAQIRELQNELQERAGEAELDMNAARPEWQHHELTPPCVDEFSRLPPVELTMQQTQNLKPVYIIPLCSDSSAFQQPGNAEIASRPATTVSKPQARYPTPTDRWPSQLLEKHP